MKTAIKERPILFSGDSIRAILDGKKTVTRRVVDHKWMKGPCDIREIGGGPEIYGAGGVWMPLECPYGEPGDRLWVREAWQAWTEFNGIAPRDIPVGSGINYLADGNEWDARKRPPMFMPRWASRITLEVASVRVERLQDITEDEATAEGITDGGCLNCGCPEPCGCLNPAPDRCDEFIWLWDQLNADRGYGWHSNPWVWRVEFERIINQG